MKFYRQNIVSICLFLSITVIGCVFVSAFVNWYNCRLEEKAGLTTGILLLPSIPQPSLVGLVGTILVVLISLRIVKIRSSFRNYVMAVGVAVVMWFAGSIGSQFLGADMYGQFLEGLKRRIDTLNVRAAALDWANQIFANQSLNANGLEQVGLPADQVPAFFKSIFSDEAPDVILYFGNDKNAVQQIEVRLSNGVDWGLLFVRSTNSFPISVYKPPSKDCGNGIYAFVHFYK